MKLKRIEHDDGAQSMSAMTDVVFLLLIFFLVTMTAYVETALLEANLPAAGASADTAALSDALRITILAPESAGEANYLVDANAFTRKELNGLLDRYGRLQKDVEILVGCNSDALHRDLVFVLSTCSQKGLNNLKLLRVVN